MVSHVHWVYSAYLLLGEMKDTSLLGIEFRQRRLAQWLQFKGYREILQIATQAGGGQSVKIYCQKVLAGLRAA